MPRYLIRFEDDRTSEPFDAVGHREAAEYAMECLLDDGAEPGEEASVYVLDDGGRGEEELVATVEVPGEEE
jgi:hypothetical protein